MSARTILAWCSGASLGLVVGALLGQSVRDAADFRAARRTGTGPGAQQPAFGHTETLERRTTAQIGVQRRREPHVTVHPPEQPIPRDRPISPDCLDRFKHPACSGDAWDDATDSLTACACPCHTPDLNKEP